MNHWWSATRAEFLQEKNKWTKAGWRFVVYKMAKTRVRWDNNQVIFNPDNALDRRIVLWDAVPIPTAERIM